MAQQHPSTVFFRCVLSIIGKTNGVSSGPLFFSPGPIKSSLKSAPAQQESVWAQEIAMKGWAQHIPLKFQWAHLKIEQFSSFPTCGNIY